MFNKFKSGLVGIIRGINPFDLKSSSDYNIERANNASNKKLICIEERFCTYTKKIIYAPILYFVGNVVYAILNRKERMKR